jgi:hypothetical protein
MKLHEIIAPRLLHERLLGGDRRGTKYYINPRYTEVMSLLQTSHSRFSYDDRSMSELRGYMIGGNLYVWQAFYEIHKLGRETLHTEFGIGPDKYSGRPLVIRMKKDGELEVMLGGIKPGYFKLVGADVVDKSPRLKAALRPTNLPVLTEAPRSPIPKLAAWARYPQEREVDWNGRKKPFLWFKHELSPRTDRHADNSHSYRIQYNEPQSDDIYDRRGMYIGSKKTGGDYTIVHNRPEPFDYIDAARQYPVHYKDIGRYKTPQEAYKAVQAHYDETHGIVRPVRPTKPKVDNLPQIPRQRFTNADKASETYFGIGHGDEEEPYYVWAMIAGKIHKSRLIQGDDEATHGSLWGHDVTNRDFKGRYEPGTGKLSVVKPRHAEFRDLPSELLRKLYQTFPDVQQVYEF